MNAFRKRVAIRVLAIHAGIVLVAALVPMLHGCFVPKRNEITTIVVFGTPAPAVQVQEEEALPEPTPPEPTPPEPTPPSPEIVPEPIPKKPDPIPKKPDPIPKTPDPTPKTPVPKPDPKPDKPAWKPTPVDPTKSTRTVAPNPKPTLSESEISKALKDLKNIQPIGNSTDLFAAYDAQVNYILKNAWRQPGVAGARPAQVKISFRDTGYISGREMVQKSGDATFDQSVMTAVQGVTTLPKPPPGYPGNNMIVNFRLND